MSRKSPCVKAWITWMDVCEEEEGFIKMTLDHDIRRPGAMITYRSGQRGRNAILISQSILFSDIQSIMIDNQIRPWTRATSRFKEFTKDNSFPQTALFLWYIDYLKCIWRLQRKQIRNSITYILHNLSKYQWSTLTTIISLLPSKTSDKTKSFRKLLLLSFHNSNL